MKPISAEKRKSSGFVQSVERALIILNRIAASKQGKGVRELARQMGLGVSTVHAMLKTLAGMNYVELDLQTRRYRLGLGAMVLGFGSDTEWHARLGAPVHDILERVSAEIGETAVMFAMINGLITCLDSVNVPKTPAIPPVKKGIFLQIPHFTSCGKALLAFSGRSFQREYAEHQAEQGRLGEEFGSAAALLEHFQLIRRRGYAEVNNLRGSQVYSVGVPVTGFFGKRNVALGISLHTSRLTERRRQELIRFALTAGNMIGARVHTLGLSGTGQGTQIHD